MATTSSKSTSNARRSSWRRRVAILAAIPLPGLSWAVAPPAFAADPAPVPAGQAKYEGFASGTFLHAEVVPTVGVAAVDLAEAHAAVRSEASGGLKDITSEIGRPISTVNATKNSSGAADAAHIEVVGQPVQLVAPSVSKATPNATDSQDLGPVDLSLASASAVHSETAARFAPNDCILGADLSYAQGRAALAAAVTSTDPLAITQVRTGDGVIDSQSRTRFVKQTNAAGQPVGTGGGVGLLSRSDVVLAPVSVAGIQITVGGTFRLQAVATGIPGAAYITTSIPDLQPDDVLTIVLPGGTTPLIEIPLGDILDPLSPLTTPVLDALATAGIADIKFSPETRTQTIAADGTAAKASADLVSVTLIDGTQVNVGHAEVSAEVPLGGIACPGIKVTKVSDKESVTVGDTFVYTITVTNPYDCRLTNVKLTDKVSSTDPSITWTIGEVSPGSSSKTNTEVVWNDIGPIAAKQAVQRQLMLTLTGAKKEGKLIDDALAAADCAIGSAQDLDQVLAGATVTSTVNLTGTAHLEAPNAIPPGTNVIETPRNLPRTGIDENGLLAGAGVMVLTGLVGSQLLRRRKHS